MNGTRVPRRRLATGDRKNEILDAALRLFARADPSLVPMEELARESGSSPALIYHYFGDKQGLALAALGAAADEMVGAMQTDPAAGVLDQLTTGLGIYLAYLQEHPVSWSALLRASAAQDSKVVALAERVDDHALMLSARALRCMPPPATLEVALRGWLDMVKGVCLRWLTDVTTDRAVIESILIGGFMGSVQSAAAIDPQCRPALEALSS